MRILICLLLIVPCVLAQEFPLELEETVALPGDQGVWSLQYWMTDDDLGWAYLEEGLLSYRTTLDSPTRTYLTADTFEVEDFTLLNLSGEPGIALAAIGLNVTEGTRLRYVFVINLNTSTVTTFANSGSEVSQSPYSEATGRVYGVLAAPPLPEYSTHVICAVYNQEILFIEHGYHDESGDVFAYDLSTSPMNRTRLGPGPHVVPFRPDGDNLYAMAGWDTHLGSGNWGTRSFSVGSVNTDSALNVDLGYCDDIPTCVNMSTPFAWQNADGSRRVATLGQVYDGNTGELLSEANNQFPSSAHIAILDSTGNEYMFTYNRQVYDPMTGNVIGTTSDGGIQRVIKRVDGIDRLVSSNNEGEVKVYRSALLITGSPPNEQSALPNRFTLSAYPNPFNPTTTLSFTLPSASETSIAIMNLLGQTVELVELGRMTSGMHEYVFDASALPSGIYFAKVSTPTMSKNVKLLLTK